MEFTSTNVHHLHINFCLFLLQQAVVKILNEPHLPRDILTVAVQVAASLVLVSPNVADCHAHLPQLLKGVSDGGRRVSEEEVKIVLMFFQELAQKYSGFEYVRHLQNVVVYRYMAYESNCATAV